MKFSREYYSDELIAEMMPLWIMHAEETKDENPMTLDPNFALYKLMEDAGSMRVYTMRQAGKLVGYQVVFIATHPHSQKVLTAQMDILFLHPEHRKGFAACNFIAWCDGELQAEGVNIVMKTIKKRLDFGQILKRMGYKIEDVTYSRQLVDIPKLSEVA